MDKYEKIVEMWSQEIQRGNLSRVRQHVLKEVKTGLPRPIAIKVAELAHRVNLPKVVIRVLNPIVRSKSEKVNPTNEEKAEYAMGLLRLGGHQESRTLLREISVVDLPKKSLYEAFSNMTLWNYKEAETNLKTYIKKPQLDHYQKLIGLVNLSSCYIFNQKLEKAKTVLEEILKISSEKEHKVLRGNAYELLSQTAFYEKNHRLCDEYINQAESYFPDQTSLGYFFIEKWKHLNRCFANPVNSVSILSDLRLKATQIGHWETLRDLDFFEAQLRDDMALARKVYVGTPYFSFRQRIRRYLGDHVKGDFEIHFGNIKNAPKNVIDIAARSRYRSHYKLWSLYNILCSDLYKPKNLVTIFSELYPDEYFDPNTSIGRAYKNIQRLRATLFQLKVHISIKEENGLYQIPRPTKDNLLISSKRYSLFDIEFVNFKKWVNREYFVSKQVGVFFDLKPTQSRKKIQSWLVKGLVGKIGSNKDKKYNFL